MMPSPGRRGKRRKSEIRAVRAHNPLWYAHVPRFADEYPIALAIMQRDARDRAQAAASADEGPFATVDALPVIMHT